MTSQKQTLLFTEETLTSSREVSHVSPTQWQENDSEKMMNAICGQKCLEQLEKFDRPTLWVKMFSALLIGTGDWFSTKCKLTWKLRGTKFGRMYFQLVPSTPPTDGTEFGLWPTPDTIQRGRPEIAQEMKDKNLPLYTRRDKAGNARQFSIVDFAIYKGMIPTPTAMDATSATATMKSTQVKEGSMHSMTLTRLLCTPTAQASRGNTSDKRGKGNLTDQIAEMDLTTSKTSQLNPRFVAEMMGFPPNWTELPFLNGETNQLKPQETP